MLRRLNARSRGLLGRQPRAACTSVLTRDASGVVAGFKGVDFSYDQNEILRDVSFSIRSGSKVSFVSLHCILFGFATLSSCSVRLQGDYYGPERFWKVVDCQTPLRRLIHRRGGRQYQQRRDGRGGQADNAARLPGHDYQRVLLLPVLFVEFELCRAGLCARGHGCEGSGNS